jgi:tetratricopeptide (TPR) repeat protein
LTPVDRDHREWLFAWIYGDVERGYRAAEALFAAAPETFAYQLGLSGVRTNRPSRAVEAFPHADLEAPWMKAWTLYWTYYADAYHMLGQLQDARVVAVRGRQLHPGSLALLRDEILVNAALGQVRDVDSLLEGAVSMRDAAGHWFALTASSAALEYRAHGHQQAAEVLFARVRGSLEMGIPQGAEAAHEFTVARVAYWSGRWHDALPVFERLVREDSSSVERLGFLGASYARADRRNEALALSEQLRALEQPYSLGLNTLWRARIAAVLGDQAQAVQLLGLAIREGQAYGIWLHREPDFEGLRAFAPFEAMIRPRPGASGATPP